LGKQFFDNAWLPMKQKLLVFNRCDLDRLLEEIRSDFFPELNFTIRWEFTVQPTLAKVNLLDNLGQISIHQVLNHADTPTEVFSLILKHELLHLRFWEEAKGWETSHSPIFWEAEKGIIPERDWAWSWIREHLRGCIRFDRELEQTKVTKNWKKIGWRVELPHH